MIKINDELFGELEYQKYFWRGKTTIQMFDMDIEIQLSVDGNEGADFSNIQREAFRNFKNEMKNIMDEVKIQIYEYYSENFEEYREMLGNKTEADSADLVKETVHLPEEFWKLSDKHQFKWLDEQIGGTQKGMTWDHTEVPG
ncbi:DUF6985 domain-containing protein [Peribacillus frigoritolerans]|uniref:DUF6985 domain-containing protein n=1 Tax=Peribacillus frigoritolerans TaxID=450367 RepID=UPI0033061490